MTAARRAPAKRRQDLPWPQRERHEPDYLLLLSVVVLASIGLLMVYSSSGISALLQVSDPFAVIGPQAFWAVSGAIVLIIFMRLDYRYLRLISVPAYILR